MFENESFSFCHFAVIATFLFATSQHNPHPKALSLVKRKDKNIRWYLHPKLPTLPMLKLEHQVSFWKKAKKDFTLHHTAEFLNHSNYQRELLAYGLTNNLYY